MEPTDQQEIPTITMVLYIKLDNRVCLPVASITTDRVDRDGVALHQMSDTLMVALETEQSVLYIDASPYTQLALISTVCPD